MSLEDGKIYVLIPSASSKVATGATIKIGASIYPVCEGVSDCYGMKGDKPYSTFEIGAAFIFVKNIPVVLLYSQETKSFYALTKSNKGYVHPQISAKLKQAPSYIYGKSADGYSYMYKPMRVKSSTEGSSKYFDITVDDSGALTATEITE